MQVCLKCSTLYCCQSLPSRVSSCSALILVRAVPYLHKDDIHMTAGGFSAACLRQTRRTHFTYLSKLFNKPGHFRNVRLSSACAKYADAFLRILLACRSYRFSRSNALILSRSAVVTSTAVRFSSSNPLTKRIRLTADLRRNRFDRSRLAAKFTPMFEHYLHGTLAHLR